MKLPFDFGVKLFFRLLLPGFFLTLGALPFLLNLWGWAGWDIKIEYTLLFTVAIAGWSLTILDMPIYMLFEGRRYWPTPLRALFLRIEKQRLKEIIQTQEKYRTANRPKYLEATVEKRKFPADEGGEYRALFPTRLGNAITAYESYPNTRYGMDAVFYWYRIWLTLDKDLKEEVDTRAAVADSAVYTSFAFFISGCLWVVYAILSSNQTPDLKHLPSPLISWAISACFLLAGYMIYRVSVFLHNQFGEVFKSVFDIHGKRVDITHVVETVADITNDPSLKKADRRKQLKSAWRYLHNYRVQCPVCGEIIPPSELGKHKAEKHRATSLRPTPRNAPPRLAGEAERSAVGDHKRRHYRPRKGARKALRFNN